MSTPLIFPSQKYNSQQKPEGQHDNGKGEDKPANGFIGLTEKTKDGQIGNEYEHVHGNTTLHGPVNVRKLAIPKGDVDVIQMATFGAEGNDA